MGADNILKDPKTFWGAAALLLPIFMPMLLAETTHCRKVSIEDWCKAMKCLRRGLEEIFACHYDLLNLSFREPLCIPFFPFFAAPLKAVTGSIVRS